MASRQPSAKPSVSAVNLRLKAMIIAAVMNAFLIISMAGVSAAVVSHPVSQLTPGTFGPGDYAFPENVSVLGNLLAAGYINATTDLCIQGGQCLSDVGTGTISEVNIGANTCTSGVCDLTSQDGSGSGLDADTLDTIESGSFLRSDADDTMSAQLVFSNTNGIQWESGINRITHNDGGGNVQIRMGHDYSSSDELFTHSGTAFYIGGNLDNTAGSLTIKVASNGGAGDNQPVTWGDSLTISSSAITFGGNTIYHAGNDGSGSALDADTLDGLNSSSFLTSETGDISSIITGAGTCSNGDCDLRDYDGSGSELDADLWDGNEFAAFLDQAVLSTSSPTFVDINSIRYIYGDFGTIARSTDEWLRLNDGGTHTSGIYTSSHLRVDGELRQGTSDYGSYGISTGTTLYADDYIVALGGLHVGGSSDPGTDNLIVDGNADISGNLSVSGNLLGGSDIAEMFFSDDMLEPGDVVVIGDGPNHVWLSEGRFDQRVAGIVSTKPALKIGSDGKYAIALAGRVLVKTTDENGKIEPGDLLTTGSTAGHAMRFSLMDVSLAQDFDELRQITWENEQRRNAILGKAMEPCERKCLITALVSLQ